MTILTYFTQILAFSLEMYMLYALGKWGYQSTTDTVWKYGLMIAMPLVAAVLWGIFAAPNSDTKLVFPYSVLFKLAIFGVTAYFIFISDSKSAAYIFYSLVIVCEILAYFLKL